MPWFRRKLLPGSKILIRQKRWWKWAWGGTRTHMTVRTPINELKLKVVELERNARALRDKIHRMEEEYDIVVKNLEKGTLCDSADGGRVDQWKHERTRKWWQLWNISCFQWAIPHVDAPLEFTEQPYHFGRGKRKPQPKRDKDFEIHITDHEKDSKDFLQGMEEELDPEGKNTTRLAVFKEGDGNRHLNKTKGESDEAFKKRQEAGKGSLSGVDEHR